MYFGIVRTISNVYDLHYINSETGWTKGHKSKNKQNQTHAYSDEHFISLSKSKLYTSKSFVSEYHTAYIRLPSRYLDVPSHCTVIAN